MTDIYFRREWLTVGDDYLDNATIMARVNDAINGPDWHELMISDGQNIVEFTLASNHTAYDNAEEVERSMRKLDLLIGVLIEFRQAYLDYEQATEPEQP